MKLQDAFAQCLQTEWSGTRGETWEAVMKEFDQKFFVTDARLDNVRDHRVDTFYIWCREQAKKEQP